MDTALHRMPEGMKKKSLTEKDRLWDDSLAYILWCGVEGMSGTPGFIELMKDGRDGFPEFFKLLSNGERGKIQLQEIINKGLPKFVELTDDIKSSRRTPRAPKPEKVLHVISLDEEFGDSESSLFDIIPGSEISPEASAVRQSSKEKLETYLDKLDERAREIISMRFGIQGYHEHTLEEVAVRFDVTRERIRQLEKDSLRKLRFWMRRDGLGASSL